MGVQKKSTSKQLAPGTFPNRLDQLIRHRGLQKACVAKALGISNTTLSYYVTGRRAVPHDLRAKCAAFLQCSLEELFPLHQIKEQSDIFSPVGEEITMSFPMRFSLPQPLYSAQQSFSPFLEETYSPQSLMPTRRQLLHHLLMIGSTSLVLSSPACGIAPKLEGWRREIW